MKRIHRPRRCRHPRRGGGSKFGARGSTLGLGLGPWRFCSRSRCRQRTGVVVLLSIRLLRLLRALSLSAALRVAQCLERLRLGSRLRLTDQSREPSEEKQLRRFSGGNASHLRRVAIFGT
jgi:hypothetical protein